MTKVTILDDVKQKKRFKTNKSNRVPSSWC